MGEKKVQYHNLGLLSVPGRLLLSLFSDNIPKKKRHQEEKSVNLLRNTLVFQTLNTLSVSWEIILTSGGSSHSIMVFSHKIAFTQLQH